MSTFEREYARTDIRAIGADPVVRLPAGTLSHEFARFKRQEREEAARRQARDAEARRRKTGRFVRIVKGIVILPFAILKLLWEARK